MILFAFRDIVYFLEIKDILHTEITGLLISYFQTENLRIFPLWVEIEKQIFKHK
jgi:hypothetical protein